MYMQQKKREIAILYLQKWNDFIFNVSTIEDNGNKVIILIERYENALNEIYANKDGYIYTLDGITFEEGKTGYGEEVVSEKEVRVIGCEKIQNILLEILNYENVGKIKIFRYPDRPKFIPDDNSDLIRKALAFFNNSGDKSVIDYCIKKHPYLKSELLIRLDTHFK